MKNIILALMSCSALLAAGTARAAPARGATPPVPSFVQTEGLGRAYLGVKLNWTMPPGTTYCEMEHSVNGRPYREYELPKGVYTESRMNMTWNADHKVRIKAFGPSGETGDWAESAFTVAKDGDQSDAITWKGQWSRETWKGWRNWGASDQAVRTSAGAGASASYAFTGTAVAWLADRGPDLGQADVLIDGNKAASVDLYWPEVRYCNVVFSQAGLTEGPHTLTVQALGRKSSASSGTGVVIHSFARISH